MDQDIKSLMVNVRNAHRYVIAYQRRLLDGIQLLDREIQKMDPSFGCYWWTPLFTTTPPQRGTNIIGSKWAWDFIPLSLVRFQWKNGDAIEGNGATYILIEHIVDTVLARSFTSGGIEPDAVGNNTTPASESFSLLAARWIRFDNPVSGDDWKREWDETIFELYNEDCDEVEERESLWPKFDSQVALQQFARNGISLGCFALSIDDFPDREHFESKFITPLLNALEELNK